MAILSASRCLGLAVCLFTPLCVLGQASTAAPVAPLAPPQTNSISLDADGTAHVTRVVPLPAAVSTQAQTALRHDFSKGSKPATEAARRVASSAGQTASAEREQAMYPVTITSAEIGGVPVRDIRPLAGQDLHPEYVLVNLHGGGFHVDSGSLTETVPLANLMHMRVVAVMYRLAPEHPFPAAVDDAVAVYRELLKTYKPEHMVIYGTSAGAILTAEVAVRLKQLKLPEPAALGIFSGSGDYSVPGDSGYIFGLHGLNGELPWPADRADPLAYIGATSPKDPVLSPLYADLHGMPPTLFLTSERDMFLSSTALLHRAFLRAGVDARLIVFEGLPHAFWNNAQLPESQEAYGYMTSFFATQLGLARP